MAEGHAAPLGGNIGPTGGEVLVGPAGGRVIGADVQGRTGRADELDGGVNTDEVGVPLVIAAQIEHRGRGAVDAQGGSVGDLERDVEDESAARKRAEGAREPAGELGDVIGGVRPGEHQRRADRTWVGVDERG